MSCILVDIDQFWCVQKITAASSSNSINVTNIGKYIFIPNELFNMSQITYLFFSGLGEVNKLKLNKIPMNKRINLRNLKFIEIYKRIHPNNVIIEFVKTIQHYILS